MPTTIVDAMRVGGPYAPANRASTSSWRASRNRITHKASAQGSAPWPRVVCCEPGLCDSCLRKTNAHSIYNVRGNILRLFTHQDSLSLLLAQHWLNQSTQRRRVLPDAFGLVCQFILATSSLIAFPLRPAWPPSLKSLLCFVDIVPVKLLSFTGQRKLAACLKLGPTV
jgi:hypothetical protein